MLTRALTDGVVTIRPFEVADRSRLIAGRDAAFHRFLGEGSPDMRPVASIEIGGRLAGWVDYDHDRSWLEPDEVNVGYFVFAGDRGGGAATAAVRLLLTHLATDTGWRVATLLIHPDNAASLGVAARAGFTRVADLDGNPYWKQPVAGGGADRGFADPLLAGLYDTFDGPRTDLDAYVAMVGEFGARSVLDVGCGTGSLACRLATDGVDVVGVDPAGASLAVARHKPGAQRVRWVEGDVGSVDAVATFDLAVMTGNVAQAFLDDVAWSTTLRQLRVLVRGGGHLVFESRDPSAAAWERWTRAATETTRDVPGVGPVTAWCDVLSVALPFVAFRWSYRFPGAQPVVHSYSTLRFRTRDEFHHSLADSGWAISDVRAAPDRPGAEWVIVAQPA